MSYKCPECQATAVPVALMCGIERDGAKTEWFYVLLPGMTLCQATHEECPMLCPNGHQWSESRRIA